ncbi:MAG TPA: vWA domain-containing protein [Chitinophagaceae bacterium]|jgi:hypothetical protein|nr:vWA domain-containing protein [Chitinophagaceae bacterium]
MTLLFKPTAAVFSIFLGLTIWDSSLPTTKQQDPVPAPITKKATQQKIQAAILLDVSGSMDGLIEQAKAQLWNMVSVMGKAKCDAGAPQIEIALYEYGRSSNDMAKGYIKQISPFTSDLDKLSQELFKLVTNGGDEYCGQVILTSLGDLTWSEGANDYKVIFIAGNEDFYQGSVSWTKACEEARKKGVIVNTIYCGSKEMGIREHWNLVGECGNGSFTNIDQNAKDFNIPTPYDSVIYTLNYKLNGTYVGYGSAGLANVQRQSAMDEANFKMSTGAGMKRAAVKGKKELYNNAGWDLVDAYETDKEAVKKVDVKTLPDSLKTKSREELTKIIETKANERASIQKQIVETNALREKFITAEKVKAATNNTQTLETEVEVIIRAQAKRFNMTIQ